MSLKTSRSLEGLEGLEGLEAWRAWRRMRAPGGAWRPGGLEALEEAFMEFKEEVELFPRLAGRSFVWYDEAR